MLLEAGADVLIQDKTGKAVLDYINIGFLPELKDIVETKIEDQIAYEGMRF